MNKHNFLVIGGGGREHALAWKLAASPLSEEVYSCPGNGGTATEPKIINLSLNWQDFSSVSNFINEKNIAACLIGPEDPLVAGLGDYLSQAGHYVFAPGAKGARLEGSKSFCKDFLMRHNIPTAGYEGFTYYDEALSYIKQGEFPAVIKFDGLAGGKGVTIARDLAEASAALTDIYKKHKFGKPRQGEELVTVIEDFLIGDELSCMIVVDGDKFSIMQTSRDHKARDDGNKGPNTGGMGAYTPAFFRGGDGSMSGLSSDLDTYIKEKIVIPTIAGLASDGIDYSGFLYAGLITDGKEAKVLEYNCRLGDPETQPLMLALKSDFAEFILNCKEGMMSADSFTWREGCCLSVVMASGGYPDEYHTGKEIKGLESVTGDEVKVFHCGTTLPTDNRILTSGGRVLAVTAYGENLNAAHKLAYECVDKISWQNCYYRKDIGKI